MTGSPSALRRFVLIAAPIVLLATFVTNDIALEKGTTGFAADYKRFVYTSLFYPFALGVLLGHWYHMLGGRFRINPRRYGGPLVGALIGAAMIACIAAVGIVTFLHEITIPSYLNTIMSVVGVVFGMLVWPVRVFHR